MNKVILIFSHNTLNRRWKKLIPILQKNDIELIVHGQNAQIDWDSFIEKEVRHSDIVYLDITSNSPAYLNLMEQQGTLKMIGGNMEVCSDLENPHTDVADQFKGYLSNASIEDLENGIYFLLQATSLKEFKGMVPKPKPTELCAIADPVHFTTYSSINEYLDKNGVSAGESRIIPFIFGRRYWISDDTLIIRDLTESLQRNGFDPVPIFCDFEIGNKINNPDHPVAKILHPHRENIVALLNLAFSSPSGSGRPDRLFSEIGKPVFQLIRDYSQTESEWSQSDKVLQRMTYNFSIAQPEVLGTIEPHLVACNQHSKKDLPQGETSKAQVVSERVDRLIKRIKRWHQLQILPNKEKKICVILHNAPCKTVEATLASAAGLDAAQSCVDLMNRMLMEGYAVQGIPENGAALLNIIQERKAHCEFRWTNTGHIIHQGGDIARIDEQTYRKDFSKLDIETQSKIDKAWEPFPAKAMVHTNSDGEPELLITGIHFGNVTVMIEPKRGCWGPKCDGEVCRILHQPDIPPTHHWLATAWYIQRHYDAIIQMGAESSLDYLPGKPVAPGPNCFPDISLGDLPRFHPYIMDSIGEGLLAKRRGKAVMVSHLTAPVRKLNSNKELLDEMLDQHRQLLHARQNKHEGRTQELQQVLKTRMIEFGFIEQNIVDEEFEESIQMLPRRIQRLRNRVLEKGKHVLGRVPDGADFELYLAEATETQAYEKTELREKLNHTGEEMDHLIHGLNGQFIPSGQAGTISGGKENLLPTGKNFYGIDLRAIPTKSAWKVGAEMGQKLLAKYLDDEKKFPESIGITLWSSDAFMAEGELTSQCLWLLGCQPVWNAQGKVSGIEAVPVDEMLCKQSSGETLRRPRIDVTVRMSGVVRDLLEPVYTLMDDAVCLVSSLDEDHQVNFVRKHVEERLESLTGEMEDLGTKELRRLATGRLFTDHSGSYGAGVGLAIDASAWNNEKDLANVYINWTGGLCGRGMSEVLQKTDKNTVMREFGKQMKGIDVAYQRSISSKYDALSISCYTGYQGGMAVTQKAMGGKNLKMYWGDSQSSGESEVRDLCDEIDLALTARLSDPLWLEEKMKEGYVGATDLSSLVNTLFSWSATTGLVEKKHFDLVTRKLIENSGIREWFLGNNVYAMEEITRRLLEADARKIWEADEDSLNAIRQASLELEGDIEDRMGDVSGEFQGSGVDIKTQDDVKEWQWHNFVGNEKSQGE